jgi:hypothetical protein
MIMMQVFFRRPFGAVLLLAGAAAAMPASVGASSISERSGSFQACLDGRFDKWVSDRVELVVNEDPKAGDIDDPAVAEWAAETLKVCRTQAGDGDRAREQLFAKRVAQWRQHIYDRVQSIRELAKPD